MKGDISEEEWAVFIDFHSIFYFWLIIYNNIMYNYKARPRFPLN